MTRNLDLFRQIVIALESATGSIKSCDLIIDGWPDQSEIVYHCVLLHEKGLLYARELPPTAKTQTQFGHPILNIERLTNAGHDFVKTIRDESQWQVAKCVVSAAKTFTLPALLDILQEMAKTGLTARWGEVLQWLHEKGWQ